VSAPTAPTAPLYGALPFPGDGVVRTPVARALRTALHQHRPDLARKKDLRICDVGCGTGETTLGLVRIFPGARVVGCDVNPASLQAARALQERTQAPVTFHEVDITRDLSGALRSRGEQGFDIVVSMGVLHHLARPADGFAAVRELVANDGAFFCFVYSRYGRWEDQAAKSLLDRAYPPNAFEARAEAARALRLSRRYSVLEFLAQLGHRLRFGPHVSLVELLQVYLRRSRLVHVSDTLSNPCEHLFSFAELSAIFDETGWTFVALADGFGMPTTADAHTSDPAARDILRRLDRSVLYDFLAYAHRAGGFGFLLSPAPAG